jgi:hypothetical protein
MQFNTLRVPALHDIRNTPHLHLLLLLLLSWPAGPLRVRSAALACLPLPSAACLPVQAAASAAAQGACLLLQAVHEPRGTQSSRVQQSAACQMSAECLAAVCCLRTRLRLHRQCIVDGCGEQRITSTPAATSAVQPLLTCIVKNDMHCQHAASCYTACPVAGNCCAVGQTLPAQKWV